MKFKIKVKNLILVSLATILIILIVLPFATLQFANLLHGMNSDKAAIFYESYLKKAIKPNEMEALYKYAVNLSNTGDKYFIMLNGWSFPQSKVTPEDMEKAKNALIKILDKQEAGEKYTSLAYRKLLDILVSTGENHNLTKYLEWPSKNGNENLKYTSSLYDALLNGDYELAGEILNNYDGALDKDYHVIRGYIELLKGNGQLAEEYYEKAGLSYWYEEYTELLEGDYKVGGKVTYNGIGIPFANIIIQEDTGGFKTGSYGFSGITDINGEYETIGLRPGRYNIGIELDHVVLYDKVHLKQNIGVLELDGDMEFNFEFTDPLTIFEPGPGTVIDSERFKVKWEPVNGADYYSIETMSNGLSYYITDKFKIQDPRHRGLTFETNKLRSQNSVYSFNEGMVPTPSSILGGFIPGFDYPIIVKAFDSSGNLLGSSQGQRVFLDQMNSINIKASLSEGENIIMNNKYEKAIEYYKKLLDNNPEDLEALKYLSKFYTLGWKEGTTDFVNAFKYGKSYYELSNDNFLLMLTLDNMRIKDKMENQIIIRDILNTVEEENKGPRYYRQLGDYYLSINQYDQALMAYEKMDISQPVTPLYIDLYLGNLDSAIKRLDFKNFQPYRMGRKSMRNSIEKLSLEDLESKDYGFLREVLEKIFHSNLSSQEGRSLYNKTRGKISSPIIQTILDEIKFEQYW